MLYEPPVTQITRCQVRTLHGMFFLSFLTGGLFVRKGEHTLHFSPLPNTLAGSDAQNLVSVLLLSSCIERYGSGDMCRSLVAFHAKSGMTRMWGLGLNAIVLHLGA